MNKPNCIISFGSIFRHCMPMLGLTVALAGFCLLSANMAQGGLATNLEAHCTMDNFLSYSAPAYWTDASGNGYDSQVNPPAYNGTGDTNGTNRGTAVDLNDGSLRMTVNDGLNTDFDPGTNDYSISLWYNSISSDSSCLLSKGSLYSATPGFSLRTADGEPLLRMNDVGGVDETKASITSGLGDLTGTGWHHLVGIFDRSGTYSAANTVSFYVDNTLAGTTILNDVSGSPYSISDAATEFIMGGQAESGTTYNMKGYLDDVAIYRGVLSTADVNTLYTTSNLDAGTISGVTPVAIHNFVTNQNHDEVFPSVVDDYGNYNGLLKGTSTQVTDAERGLVLESGTDLYNDYVTFGDVLDPMDQSYTAAFWFKISDSADAQVLAANGANESSNDKGWATIVSGSDYLNFRANYDGTDADRKGVKLYVGDDLNFYDEWHHMAVVFDQTNGRIIAYLDGQGSGLSGTENDWELNFEGNDFTPGTLFSSWDSDRYDDLTLLLGSRDRPANGYMDDFAVWSRALSDAEILGIFNGDEIPEGSIPGDTNGDYVVDETDAAMVASNWGATTTEGASEGDFNDDGVVNAADASIMAANWGDHNEGVGEAAVPEPGALALLLTGIVWLSFGSRRGRRE